MAWAWHEIVSGEHRCCMAWQAQPPWPAPGRQPWHVAHSPPAAIHSPPPPADYVRATLAWLENPRRSNLNALVRKYNVRDNIACLTEKREGCRGRG